MSSGLFGVFFPVLKTEKTVNINSMAKKVKTPMATHMLSPPEKYTRGKQSRGRTSTVSITKGNARKRTSLAFLFPVFSFK